jgi:hypothetical protein
MLPWRETAKIFNIAVSLIVSELLIVRRQANERPSQEHSRDAAGLGRPELDEAIAGPTLPPARAATTW